MNENTKFIFEVNIKTSKREIDLSLIVEALTYAEGADRLYEDILDICKDDVVVTIKSASVSLL